MRERERERESERENERERVRETDRHPPPQRAALKWHGFLLIGQQLLTPPPMG